MSIIAIYKDYYQKSTMFLYPALKIRRGASESLVRTYLAWDGMYTIEDKKLICVYYLRDDYEFSVFEKEKLVGNEYFEAFYQLEDNKGAYVFDLSHLGDTYDHIAHGKYSKIDPEYKVRIMAFFSSNRGHSAYMESYLYPNKFFNLYAKLLTTQDKDVSNMLELLKSVGELCSPPRINEETINLKPKTLNYRMDSVSLLHSNQ